MNVAPVVAPILLAATAISLGTARRIMRHDKWRTRLEMTNGKIPSFAAIGYSGALMFFGAIAAFWLAARAWGWWALSLIAIAPIISLMINLAISNAIMTRARRAFRGLVACTALLLAWNAVLLIR